MSKLDDRDQLGLSRLPMPPSDSPLVIDLPDGQKLVLGNMPAGSVIEVATWRGTGRPDSRTSRLMLGVSNAETQKEDNNAEVSEIDQKRFSLGHLYIYYKSILKALKAVLSKFFTRLQEMIKTIFSKVALLLQARTRMRFTRKSHNKSTQNTDFDEEISQWLGTILAKNIIEPSPSKYPDSELIPSGRRSAKIKSSSASVKSRQKAIKRK